MTINTGAAELPEALRLADLLLALQTHLGPRRDEKDPDEQAAWDGYTDAAAALCRLHAENEALRAQQDDAYDHGPQAETVEEAARDVGKWLNERPNRPLDLRHVAMLTHHAKPAAHVQNPAEIEHVAGDVSKNGAESNMNAQQPAPATQQAQQQEAQEPVAVVVPCYTPSGKRVALYSAKQDLPIGTQLYTAPQPSPTAQVASSAVLKAIREANMQLVRTGDNAFMLVPYKVATAQAAGSVPAPVLDSLALMKVVMQADEALSGRCTRGTTNWAAAIGKAVQDAVLAARAPAESVTAPAGGATAEPRWKSEDFEVTHYPPMPTTGMRVGMPRGVKVTHRPTGLFAVSEDERSQHRNREVAWNKLQEMLAAPTPPAQAAESAGRDADRYRWLRVQDSEDFEFAVVKNPHFDTYESPEELDAAIDAALAAQREVKP